MILKKTGIKKILCIKEKRDIGSILKFLIQIYQYQWYKSGFADGVYPVYFGHNQNNKLYDAVIEYIYVL